MARNFHLTLTRLADLVLAGVGLALVAPFLLLVAILVRSTSPGPAIFAQVRVGRFEREFVCYKVRTMFLDTKSAGTHEVSSSAVTPIGRFLRSSKIDELPQLWNVVRGEMSLVGPRPGLPVQTALIEARRKRDVYSIRPGVTGPGQVAGVDMADPERLAQVDSAFVQRPTFPAYLRYIILTVLGAGQGDRVSDR
jgi:O-antigen biosynthesis protein WbqP